jgi:CO/xanthine dehydrogenase Mo-binding subunit
VVGQPVQAADARERVTGRAEFAVDIEVPGMLHAKVLRSTEPHGHIKRLDVSAAESAPGVVAVLTGADLVAGGIEPHYGPIFPDRPLLATDRVRFAGEPVAVVIARDLDAAEDALERVDVEYDSLEAYFDAESALAPDAIPLHESLGDRGFKTYPDLVLNPDVETNVLNHFKIRRGDVERGFAESDEVFEGLYHTPALQHVSLEPHVCICRIDRPTATVWTSASSPYTVRFQVAETLGLPQAGVRVVVSNIGGAYGGKSYPRIEPLVAAASWRVGGRPVRLEYTRAEEFFTVCRHAAAVRLRTGVTSDGALVARQVRVLWSAGAYADISPRVAKNGGYAAVGPYRVPHVWVDSLAVYTNTTPAGGFRGYGVPQVAWAYESQLDEIAAELQIDPVELRRRNLLADGDLFSTGQVLTDLHYHELLDGVAAGLAWEPRDTPRATRGGASRARGKGVAATAKGTVTPSTSTASLRVDADGSVWLLAGTTEIGQGARTALRQIAADALGVSLERVEAPFPDTQLLPWDQTTSSSRSTMSMGAAIQDAARHVHEQLRELAAPFLGAGPEELEFALDGVHVRDDPSRRLTLQELFARSDARSVGGSGEWRTEGHLDDETGQGVATSALFQGVAGAEVEVDLETGRVTVLDLRVGVYAGRVVHPTFAELQCEGNVAFGVSAALFEELELTDGQVSNPSLGDYMIASFDDMPRTLGVSLLESGEAGARLYGIGESAIPAIAPAIGNAVRDACGVRVTTLPITPEKILKELRR